ncbi:MAG: ABC transporter permease [Vicinamibacterales bacterium]
MRAYRLLLHLYPAAMRETHGDELAAMFAHDLARAQGAARAWVVIRAIVDTIVNALRAHVEMTALDLRDVWRGLRRSPGYASSVVLVSALGVAAATASFSLADHVLVRPLPFASPDRLVKLWQDQSSRGYSRMELSPGNYVDWQRGARSFVSMAAFTTRSVNALTGAGPVRFTATRTTPSLFETLGVGASLGRAFMAADDRAPAPPGVVLSDHVWQSVFGGRADVLGTTVTLDGTAHTVVGVMPAWFEFPTREVDVWLPLMFAPADLEDRADTYLQAVARLAPGVTMAQARSDLGAVAAGLARAYPANDRTGATVIGLRDEVTRQSRAMLQALVGASAAVLLIACANLASLLLARGVARQRELSIRLAMGARPRRLARQVMTESLALSGLGGGLGVALAMLVMPVAAALVPTTLPIADAPAADLRVLAVAAIATLVTGLGFGLVPAWRVARTSAGGDLQHGTRVFGGRSTERLRGLFVAGEVAVAVVLLVTVGLFLQALWQVREIDPGFDASGVLTARTTLPLPKYERVAVREAFYRRVLDDVRALPGVQHAAYTSFLPMVMRGGIWPVLLPGTTVPEDARTASVRFVTPDYFAAMGIPLVRGRGVADTDRQDTGYVAVVSRSFAELYWPGEDPIGQHFTTALQARVVVGVVGDVRVRGLERESEPQVYLPSTQVPDGDLVFYVPKDLVVKASGAPAALVASVRAAVQRADPEQPVSDVRLLTDVVERETASRVTQVSALIAFAAVAVLLTLVGLHSLLAYVVAARTQEIGVRMALGASRLGVLSLVWTRAARLTVIGTGAGLVLAYAASRSVQALLAGISAADAATYAVAAAGALAIGATGSLVPAWRASRVDPVAAMRHE